MLWLLAHCSTANCKIALALPGMKKGELALSRLYMFAEGGRGCWLLAGKPASTETWHILVVVAVQTEFVWRKSLHINASLAPRCCPWKNISSLAESLVHLKDKFMWSGVKRILTQWWPYHLGGSLRVLFVQCVGNQHILSFLCMCNKCHFWALGNWQAGEVLKIHLPAVGALSPIVIPNPWWSPSRLCFPLPGNRLLRQETFLPKTRIPGVALPCMRHGMWTSYLTSPGLSFHWPYLSLWGLLVNMQVKQTTLMNLAHVQGIELCSPTLPPDYSLW